MEGRLTAKDWKNPMSLMWIKLGLIPMRDEVYRISLSKALSKLARYEDLEEAGRLITLPCAVGDPVWIIASCRDVLMQCDNDYLEGTGTITCPYETTCEDEECGENDDTLRVFKTTVINFWLGEEDREHPEMFFEDIGKSAYIQDFGKTVFLTSEAAEEAIKGNSNEEIDR